MNVVDSCGWLEYFSNGSNARFFASAIEDTVDLVVPAVCLYEVFKRTLEQSDETGALRAVAQMRLGRVVLLDEDLALWAAKLSLAHGLPFADSVILATARAFGATIWTQDADFKGIDGVKYIQKP